MPKITPAFNGTLALSQNLNLATGILVASKIASDQTIATVLFIEKIRWLVTMSLLSVIAAYILLLLYGAYTRTTVMMKRHVIAMIPIFSIFHIISLALFIASFSISDSCTYVLGNRSFAPFVSSNYGLNISSIESVQDMCGKNNSIIKVANNIGYIDSASSLSDYTKTGLNNLNFSPILSQLKAV